MNVYTKRNRQIFSYFKFFLYLFVILAIVSGGAYLNYHFKVQNINVSFFDENKENAEIKNYTEGLLRTSANNLYKYILLDEDEISSQIHNEHETVSSVKISKNLRLDLNVVISKNQEFFYTCVSEDTGFLARCMLGNTDGQYYKEIDNNDDQKLSIEINPKVLYDARTEEKIEEPDSLSGSRIYTKEDFKVLREVLKWVQKNGFAIDHVYVDELKVVEIYTSQYMIKISLDKGYADTVKDFELISRTGNLQKYINEEKDRIQYIDLSFKNKVFYKLKGGETPVTEITATTSTSTIN